MNRLLTVALILVSASFVSGQTITPETQPKEPHGQAKAAIAKAKATPNKTIISPSQQQGPKGDVVTPKPISLGDSTIPGDAEVQADLGNLNLLSAKYQEELKEFQTKLNEKYQPEWSSLQTKIQASVKKVKDANKWGDDVVFDATTKQWIKLAPSEVKAIEKAVAPTEAPKQEPKK